MAGNDLRIKIVGTLNTGKSIGEINSALRGIEQKINKLKINIKIDDKALSTLNNFSKQVQKIASNGMTIDGKGMTNTFSDIEKASKKATGQQLSDLNNVEKGYEQLTKKVEKFNEQRKKVSETNTYSDPKGILTRTETLDGKGKETGSSITYNPEKMRKDLEAQQKAEQALIDKMAKFREKATLKRYSEEKKLAESQAKAINKNTELELATIQKVKTKRTELLKQLQIISAEGKISSTTFEKMSSSLKMTDNIKQLDKFNNTLAVLKRNSDRKSSMGELIGSSQQLKDLSKANEQNVIQALRLNGAIKNQDIIGASLNRTTGQWSVTLKENSKQQRTIKGDIDKTNGSIFKQSDAIRDVASRNLGFMEQFKIAMARVPLWAASMTAFYGSIRALQSSVAIIVEIDTQLTELKKVMDDDTNFAIMLDSSIENAEKFSVAIQDINTAMAGFARMGFAEQEVIDLSATTAALQQISDLSSEDAMGVLASSMVQFNKEASESIRVADALNEVDNRNAVTVAQLAQSMSRAGDTAKTFGISMENLLGYTTAIATTTRESGNVIGNGLKSIFSRITTMDESIGALKELNIEVEKSDGTFRNVDEILSDLAGKWGSLSNAQQQNTAVTLAGRYQLSRFLAMMSNWDIAMKASSEATDSQGSAMAEVEKRSDSLQARIARLKNGWTELSLAMGDVVITDSLVGLISGLTSLAKLGVSVSNSVGVLPVVLGLVVTGFLLTTKSIKEFVVNSKIAGVEVRSLSAAFVQLRSTATASATSMNLATTASRGFMVALRGLAAATGIGLLFVGVGIAIEKLISYFADAAKEAKELEKEQKKITQSYGTQRDEIDSLIKKYEELANVQQRSTTQEQEFLDVQNKLGSLMPNLIDSVDEYGQMRIKSGDALKNELKYAKELVELQKANIASDATDKFKEQLKARQEANKEAEKLRKQIESAENPTYDPKGDRLTPSMFSEDELNKLEMKLRGAERNIANSNLAIRDEVGKLIEEILRLNGIDIDPAIVDQINGIKNSLDVKDMNAEELGLIAQDFSESIGKFQEGLKNATSIGQIQVLEQGVKAWAKEMGFTKEQSQSLISTLVKQAQEEKNVSKSTDDAKMSLEEFRKAISDSEDDFASLSKILKQGTKDGFANEAILSAQSDAYKALADEVSPLNELLEKVAQGKNISAAEAMELVAQEEELANAISVENGVIKINEKAVKNLRDAKIKSYSDMLEAIKQEAIQTANKTLANLKNYGLEISAIKNLADAKNKLAQANRNNDDFYNDLARGVTGTYNPSVGVLANVTEQLENIEKLQELATAGLSVTGTEAAKSYERSVYVSDKFKQALEKVNAELERQNQIQAKFPKHSKEYQNSIKVEIDLLKQKKRLLEDQARILEAQIKAGKIQQTGVITQSVSPAPSSNSYASGNSSSAQIWNFFKSKGFSDGIAAGIMGNLKLESGLNPNALNSSSGAFGIAQWLGGRKTQLKKFAATMGTSINDLNTQLEFLWKELNSTEKRTLNYLNGNQGASAATIAAAFDRLFERSEGTHIPQRQKYANQFYSQYSGTAGAYVSSSTTGSQEAAKAMESVDQAKSELIQLKLDALEIDGLISQLQVDLVNAEFAKNERTIRQIESHLKIYEDNFEEAVKGQWMYEVSLQNQINLLNNKRKILQEEQKYISTQIRTNKGLTQAQKSELEMRNLDIRDSLIELNNSIKELSWEKTLHSLVKFTSEVEKMDYKLRLSKQNQALFNKESEGYASELNSQRGFILDKIVAMEREKIAIDQIRASQNLDQQQKKELNDRYLELKVSILEAQDALQELQNEASQSKLDNVLSQIDKVVDGISRKLKEIDNKIHVTDPEDEKAMIALYNERLDALLEQRKAALDNIESLEAIRNELGGNDEALKQNADEIQKWKDSLSDVDISIFDQKQTIEDYYEDIANSYVEAMKEAYEAEKKVKLENLNKIREAEEKAHNDRMKEMDEESKAIDEQYNKQLRALNDQESADDYAKELSKKQTSAQELQAKINALSMDDSEWAKKERERLEKELAEMQEEIEQYKNDRALELRRQSLEDERNAKQEQLDSEREAENKAWDERQKALDEQRQQIEQYYEDLLENEREWAKMREDIMNGNVDYYKTKLEEMAKFVSDNGKIIGDSIAQNISDALNKAKENIGSITESIKDLFATVDKESKQQDSNAEQTATQRKQTEEEPPTTGKLIINKPIKLWTRKNGKLEYVRGLNPGETYKVYDYDEKYGGQFNVGNNHWVTDMAGYVKFQKYHDGGIVGGKGSRLTELANKLFNEKPNEQTVTALKRELFAPEKNMPNFFNNIKNFSSSLVKPTGTPSVVYNLDLTIGSVTGNKDGGKVVFGEVVKGLKKMGKL